MSYKVIERRMIVPNIHELVVEAPDVARSIQPGQFIIVRPNDKGERIPLSVSDFDAESGALTSFFQEVGESTSKLALLRAGDTIPTYVGPLGEATEVENYGTVLLVGGCFGIGSLYPIARTLKEAGNRVFMVSEARSTYLLYWQDRYKKLVDGVFTITRDGTHGAKGHVENITELLGREEIRPDRVIVNGCTFLMKRVSDITRPLGLKTVVSMNPIMIDGTGMCGVCRLSVGGEIKFACVDGPDFDGHLIDWDEFLARRKTYNEEETAPLRKSDVGTVHHGGCCSRS
ncbi:MAG: sulfide/dihydroorotate dehydrogenase-like FAD/NAD-binding protein [Candidatus Eisenbacteria bacterium]|nr:sulfide/dihydroorotate dehydrogenase-like FAD/NAD-binding protein [Candidatus Eisenbacteria bacterium]